MSRGRAGSGWGLPPTPPADPDLPNLGIRLVPSRAYVRSATCRRYGDRRSGLSVPGLLPTDSSAARRPLPSTGFPSHRFPRRQRYYEALRLPATIPPRFVCASLGGTAPRACLRSSAQARRRPAARSFADWQPPRQKISRRSLQGLPRFPGTPAGPMPCSSTPAGPVTPRRGGAPTWPVL